MYKIATLATTAVLVVTGGSAAFAQETSSDRATSSVGAVPTARRVTTTAATAPTARPATTTAGTGDTGRTTEPRHGRRGGVHPDWVNAPGSGTMGRT